MIFLDDKNLKNKILYKKEFYLPINRDDKRRGAMCFLLSPNFKSSVDILTNQLMNIKYYTGYYIEKSIAYYINQENATVSSELDIMNEDALVHDINYGLSTHMKDDYEINEEYIRCKVDGNDILLIKPESTEVYTEAVASNNTVLRRILWNERYKTPKDVLNVYSYVGDEFKRRNIEIDKMFLTLKRYKQFNLFCDLSFYNETFFKNNIWKLDKGVDLYFDFITRFLKDPRFLVNGYTKQTIIIPVDGWSNKSKDGDFKLYTNDINPISMLLRLMKKNFELIKKEWKDFNILFLGRTAYFKLDFNELELTDIPKLRTLINKLILNDTKEAEDVPDSKEALKADVINKIEKSQSIEVKSLTGDNSSISKAELVDKIDKAAAVSNSEDEVIEVLDQDDEFKKLVVQLGSTNKDININATRTARMEKLNDEVMGKKIHDTSLKELIEYEQPKELPTTKLNLDTINPEWEELKYVNFDSSYNIDADIAKIIEFFYTRSLPIAMRNVKVEDTSSSEDWIYTYTVECEDYLGQRFTLKFDIPKFKDNRYMYLRGNEKILNGQLMQLPISKTDQDTVQIVSNYNKIFIRRYGSAPGKSGVIPDRIIKTINKMRENKDTSIKVTHGDNRKICSKYHLPYEYIDLSSEFSRLETSQSIYYFNQDEIRNLYVVNDKKGIPYKVDKKTKSVYYFNGDSFGLTLYRDLQNENKSFNEIFENTKESSKYCYSKASVLGVEIPVIVIMSYHVGLINAMKTGGVKFEIVQPRTRYDHLTQDVIKFKDAWILYELDYNSSLLMNGMKECDTINYSISEENQKEMYLDFLDSFGGRIKADGLDNFYDLMIDPITADIIKIYGLPNDYIQLLAYANNLLEDNKYIKHTDLSGKRYRSNEIIAGLLYNELAASYGQYKIRSKRIIKGNAMAIKQSAVIDALLALKTSSDASILNALLDVESMNAVSFKGLSGMNADRAYDLDKRTYDKSMINALALSTGFAGNVGITRQTTIDMNISGSRGLMKSDQTSEDVGIRSLCMTEAVTPYSVNHDDPFRSAMTFIQTSKHFMRTTTMNPRLITNGADEALPYMASNTFAFKAKQPGKVIEKTDQYMILEYRDGSHEYINLDSKIVKNSSGGFFGSIKLESDYKVGQTFKSNEIVAYDKGSFDGSVGATDNIAYNAGTLCKMAVLYTDEGIEDSGIVSEWLSEALSSEVISKVEVYLNKSTNVFNMVKVGQKVEEGDILISFQEATDDEDVNLLMKALGSDEEEISSLGRINKISKYTGDIADIKIYRTAEVSEMSESLQKIVKEYDRKIDQKKSVMRKYDINQEYTLEANYKLPPSGKLKKVNDGILIEFYIRFIDKFSVGDKAILDAALKNVAKDIFPIGEEPYSEFRPEEEVSTFASLSSINGRMVTSILSNGCLNKIIIELDRAVKDKLGIKWKPINEMNK